MKKYTTVLFDLDGTLTDPYEGVVNCFAHTLAQFGLSETNEDTLRTYIGPPLDLTFSETYGFSREDTKKAVEIFRKCYAEKGVYENKLYPGIPGLLTLLTSQGRTCMVATSKGEQFALQVLDHFDIRKYFFDVAGATMDESRSDKAEIIAYLLEKHHVQRDTAVMIGDRKYDIAGAKKNGLDSIAVGYGHGSGEEFREAGPTYFCKDMEALMAFFS